MDELPPPSTLPKRARTGKTGSVSRLAMAGKGRAVLLTDCRVIGDGKRFLVHLGGKDGFDVTAELLAEVATDAARAHRMDLAERAFDLSCQLIARRPDRTEPSGLSISEVEQYMRQRFNAPQINGRSIFVMNDGTSDGRRICRIDGRNYDISQDFVLVLAKLAAFIDGLDPSAGRQMTQLPDGFYVAAWSTCSFELTSGPLAERDESGPRRLDNAERRLGFMHGLSDNGISTSGLEG